MTPFVFFNFYYCTITDIHFGSEWSIHIMNFFSQCHMFATTVVQVPHINPSSAKSTCARKEGGPSLQKELLQRLSMHGKIPRIIAHHLETLDNASRASKAPNQIPPLSLFLWVCSTIIECQLLSRSSKDNHGGRYPSPTIWACFYIHERGDVVSIIFFKLPPLLSVPRGPKLRRSSSR